MLIIVYIAETYEEHCQKSNVNVFARIVNGNKGEFETMLVQCSVVCR